LELAIYNPAAIARELDQSGFYCAEGVVSPGVLADCRATVAEILSRYGDRPISLIQPWKDYPAFAALASATKLQQLLPILSAIGGCTQDGELYNVIRIVSGHDKNQGAAFAFHYDSTVITALVPLFIPDGAPDLAGDFICVPNRRPLRRSSAVNLIEKALVQNSLARVWFARMAKRHDPRMKVMKMVPGNIYFFWGYRTFHSNFTCAPGVLRATILFHFGDPHSGSLFNRLILRLRRFRVRRALARP
jgi:hypothetical protein